MDRRFIPAVMDVPAQLFTRGKAWYELAWDGDGLAGIWIYSGTGRSPDDIKGAEVLQSHFIPGHERAGDGRGECFDEAGRIRFGKAGGRYAVDQFLFVHSCFTSFHSLSAAGRRSKKIVRKHI